MADTDTAQSRAETSLAEAERIAALLTEHAATHDREASFPDEGFDAIVKSPINTALIDGAGWLTFGRIVSVLSRADASFATAWLMHQGSGAAAMALADPGQRDQLLTAFRSGTWFANALSEPTSGNLFLMPLQQAHAVDGGWRLEGAKRFVSGCEKAKYLLTNAVCDGKPSFFVIDRDDSVEIVECWDTMGMRATRSQLLQLRDTFLPENRLLVLSPTEPTPIGFGLAWISIGVAEAAMGFAVDYAKNRTLPPDGRALADMQWVQFAVADMALKLGAARAFAEKSAAATEQRNPEFMSLHLQSKVVANEAAVDIARSALEIAGGSGYFRTQPIERYLRDALSGPLMAHSTAVIRDFVGKTILGRGPVHE